MTTAVQVKAITESRVRSWPGKDPRPSLAKNKVAMEVAAELGGVRSGRTQRWDFPDESFGLATANGFEPG